MYLVTFFGIELHAFNVCFCKKGYKYPVKSGVHYLGLMNTINLHKKPCGNYAFFLDVKENVGFRCWTHI